jgi:hypothetical protein
MSLTELWGKQRDQLLEKRVSQVIAFAGSGRLTDESPTSHEFRDFLNHVSSVVLSGYADDCLRESFTDSGFALQDIINQVGKRLGLSVTDGKYRGRHGQTGEDGIWALPDGHAIVIEVKTTDAYRIDIDRLAEFRRLLAQAKVIDIDKSSNLIVVGRQDTGDLEAQIRGSRHAWDFRVISVDALIRLMKLKESIEDPKTLSRIHAILIPREFTRLDAIVDTLFPIAEEVTQGAAVNDGAQGSIDIDAVDDSEREPKFTPVRFHEACVVRLEASLKTTLVKRSRSTYESPDAKTRLICSISKEHGLPGNDFYWFAFHPYYFDFLKGSERPLAAFGCGSEQKIFLFPAADLEPWFSGAYVTKRDDTFYWHVQLYREGSTWWFKRRQEKGNIEVTRYLLI